MLGNHKKLFADLSASENQGVTGMKWRVSDFNSADKEESVAMKYTTKTVDTANDIFGEMPENTNVTTKAAEDDAMLTAGLVVLFATGALSMTIGYILGGGTRMASTKALTAAMDYGFECGYNTCGRDFCSLLRSYNVQIPKTMVNDIRAGLIPMLKFKE